MNKSQQLTISVLEVKKTQETLQLFLFFSSTQQSYGYYLIW